MTQAIQSSNAAAQYAPHLSSREQAGRMSYREAMTEVRQSDISITTDEGDVVTISSYQGEEQSLAYDKWNSPLQQGMNFTASSLKIDSFNLSIQGDLNEEELLDIEYLLEDLSLIAGDFFNGDLDKAMDGSLNIGDMGSLAEMSASFSYSASWSASQITENHPIPASGAFEDLMGDFMSGMPEAIVEQENPEMEYAQKLQAQWQQIKEILEDRENKLAEIKQDLAKNEDKDTIPAAHKMMSKMEEMMAKHPRLSPFAMPLAHEAIDNEASKLKHPGIFDQKNQLKDNILQEINDWMYA